MTGAGRAVREGAPGRVEVEAQSVNHRFLKVGVRAHGPLPPLDGLAEEAARACLARGHVSLTVRFTPAVEGGGAAPLDAQLFAAAVERLTRLAALHALEPPTLADVLMVPGVLAPPPPAAPDSPLAALAREAIGAALADLVDSRAREGARLVAELGRLLDEIAEHTARAAALAADAPRRAAERLRQRMGALLEAAGLRADPAALAHEAALAADRGDVREEVARLEAHVAHARELLAAGEAPGRRLDFLAQEFAREANTLSAKAAEWELGRLALDLKTAVERLREQVQNLE